MDLPTADATQTEPTQEEPGYRLIFLKMVYDLNQHIDSVLKIKGMTRRDLARLLGKYESEIGRWFSGGHNLTLETIAKISAVLEEPLLVTPTAIGVAAGEKEPGRMVYLSEQQQPNKHAGPSRQTRSSIGQSKAVRREKIKKMQNSLATPVSTENYLSC